MNSYNLYFIDGSAYCLDTDDYVHLSDLRTDIDEKYVHAYSCRGKEVVINFAHVMRIEKV